jgi:Mrp family chromosome partitioning ATPase
MLGRLRLGDGAELPERLGLTSALSGEGTTYLCRTIALVLANDAARQVCIVDLNWASPSYWPNDEGLQAGIADVIRGTTDLDHAVLATGNPGLSVLRAGDVGPIERPALAHSPELDKILDELSETFDHVLLDLPAVHAASEALTLAERSRALALVVNQGVTPDQQVQSALEELSGVPVIGVILNRSSSKVPRMIRRRIPGF